MFKTGASTGKEGESSSGVKPPSVFGASGFGALADSSKSGFAALGKSSTGSVFGGGLGAKSTFGSGIGTGVGNPFRAQPAAGGLGGSPFGSFGGLSGAGGRLGGGLSTPGSSYGLFNMGAKPDLRPFGGPDSDNEGDQAEGEEGPRFGTEDPDEHKDERFHEQEGKKKVLKFSVPKPSSNIDTLLTSTCSSGNWRRGRGDPVLGTRQALPFRQDCQSLEGARCWLAQTQCLETGPRKGH